MRPVLLLFFLAACIPADVAVVRRPCPDDPAWDPNRPLAVRWATSGVVELNEHVAQRIRVVDADSVPLDGVPFAFAGGLGWCALGGLAPDADFHWTFTTGDEPGVQEWDDIGDVRSGTWSFHTAATSELAPPTDVLDCRDRAKTALYDDQCPEFETGGAP